MNKEKILARLAEIDTALHQLAILAENSLARIERDGYIAQMKILGLERRRLWKKR